MFRRWNELSIGKNISPTTQVRSMNREMRGRICRSDLEINYEGIDGHRSSIHQNLVKFTDERV